MKRSSLASLLIFSFFATAFGQTPVQQTPEPQTDQDEVVRITTNLVQVDAVVTDKKGNPVTDLKPEDFEITEDGRAQAITNLSYISTPTATTTTLRAPASVERNAPPAPPVRLRPEQVRRTMALVVDDLGLSFQSVYYVRRALKKFVEEQMQSGDLVAIIRTGGGIGVLQQFTSDKRQLYAAIERIRWNMLGRGGVGAFAPIEGNTANEDEATDEEAASSGANRAKDDLDEFRSEIFAVGTLGAVNYIVRGLRDLPGRKSVLLISDGFRIFNRNNDNRRVLEALRRLTDLANRASVVIYTMDARGLQTLGLTAADDVSELSSEQVEQRLSDRRDELFETQTGLIYLAQQTGGFNIRNSNDLNAGIRRVIEDQRGYYLIGYRPDESTFDPKTGQRRFHKINVRVKRPGLQVRSRAGFYGITDERAVPERRTREQQLNAALISPFNSNAIDIRLTSLFGNHPRAGSYMRSLLYIDASDLSFTEEADGWHKTVIDVVALTFGDNGQVIDQVNRTQTVRVRGNTFQNVMKNGLVYVLNVPVKKAGAYQLRVAVRDAATEQVGSASQFVEVPDLSKNRLTLSGIVVNGYEPKTAQAGAPSSQTGTQPSQATTPSNGAARSVASGAEGAQEELDPQAGAAVRHFRHGMVMNYGYMIYNAQADKATRRPQLETQIRIFREGQLVFTGKVQPLDINGQSDLARLAAGGALRLGSDMPPGEYVLQVIVRDLLTKDAKRRTATQWIDFEIVK
ncbi:MAG: VWA domain-containing protein [Pyrinomonadaceae bacterium]|nr:VWA domain-containing protein [Pyrinomonadaceae bacterium]